MHLIDYFRSFDKPILFNIDTPRLLIDALVSYDKNDKKGKKSKNDQPMAIQEQILYHTPYLITKSLEGATVKALDDKEMTYFTQFLSGIFTPHFKTYTAPTLLIIVGVESLELKAQDALFRFLDNQYSGKNHSFKIVMPVKNKEKISFQAVNATVDANFKTFEAFEKNPPSSHATQPTLPTQDIQGIKKIKSVGIDPDNQVNPPLTPVLPIEKPIDKPVRKSFFSRKNKS